MLEKLEDEFILIFWFMKSFVWLDIIVLLAIFPKHSFSELISEVDSLVLFFEILSDVATIGADVELMEDIEVGHVQNWWGHVSELDTWAVTLTKPS